MTDKNRGAVYREGKKAHDNGLLAEKNPYTPRSYNHGAWGQGWFDAEMDECADPPTTHKHWSRL